MADHPTWRTDVIRVDTSARSEASDVLAVEEPLEIRIGDRPVAVTMRTPGDDVELATGFLYTEGIIGSGHEVESARHWGSPNVVRVTLRSGVSIDLTRLQRHFYASASCGICGKTSIDAVRIHAKPVVSGVVIDQTLLAALPDAVRQRQRAFAATGGIHGAGLFSATADLLAIREDIGRHNAVDKVIGAMLREHGRVDAPILVVTGRAGFEIVQKAVIARIAIVVAVGAPSSLAVDLAREFGVTLAGFVRDGRFNLYSGEERVS